MMPISPVLYITIFSLIKLGTIVVFIDPTIGPAKIDLCCKNCKPDGFIGCKKTNILKIISKNIRTIPIKIILTDKNLKDIENRKQKQTEITNKYAQESLLFIRFTTGSTGEPKGVQRTYSYTCNMIKAIHDFFPQKQNDIDLTMFPMNTFYNLVNGTTTFLPNKKIDTKDIIKTIKECKITTTSASPFILEKITNYCLQEKIILPNIRFAFTGGGPPSINLINNINKILPNSENYIVYGSTEAFPISWIKIDKKNQENIEKTKSGKGLCLGKSHKKLEITIIKPIEGKIIIKNEKDFKKIILKPNTIGEIIIQGPQVSTRYYKDKKDIFSKNKIIDHKKNIWHRTGDSGYIDSQKRIWITGRKNSIYKIEKKTISNLMIEYMFDSQKEIKKSAIIKKDKLNLIIQPEKKQDKKILKQKIEKKLSKEKIQIEKIIFLKKIPLDKRHNTKVDYKKLIEKLTIN